MRPFIWHIFEGRRDNLPMSFDRTIKSCVRLPEDLRERLHHSWATHGQKLKKYRDCIQPYFPLFAFAPNAHVTRLENNVISVSFWIPDNPEVRSQRNLSFGSRLDALSYGWELANEVVDLASFLIGEALNTVP